MPNKLPILPMTHVADETALRSWTVTAVEARHITRRQFTAVTMLAARHLPCHVELLQRSSKSVLYLRIDGALEYRIGQRAQVYGGIARKL